MWFTDNFTVKHESTVIADKTSRILTYRSLNVYISQLIICQQIWYSCRWHYKMFNPIEHGLKADFRLTKYSTLRGWGCKVPQEVLTKLLAGVQLDLVETSDTTKNDRIGIGMDSAVIPLQRHSLSLVQSVDCFYPLVDDPYNMGKSSYNMSVTSICIKTLFLQEKLLLPTS